MKCKLVNVFAHRKLSGNGLDIATGSAAGPAAAYLYKHQFVSAGHPFQIKQGHFVGRPSEMIISIDDHSHERPQISVKGQVCKIANIDFV